MAEREIIGKPLSGRRFQTPLNTVEDSKLYWTSANPETTQQLIDALNAADIPYNKTSSDGIDTITIPEDQRKAVVEAGGSFNGSVRFATVRYK